jgi:hypothetical protein
MNKLIYIITTIGFINLLIQDACFAQKNYIDGQVIVRIQENVTIEAYKQEISPIEISQLRQLSKHRNIWLLYFSSPKEVMDIINYLQTKESTIYVQANYFQKKRCETIPNDSRFGEQNHLEIIGMNKAWSLETGGYTKDGDKIVVAVIDGGFLLSHEDLNFWTNSDEIPDNGIDDDNNGIIDDFRGFNAADNNGIIDTAKHGTRVAGLIGAKGNNRIGVTGVNWDIEIMPIQYFGASSEDEDPRHQLLEASVIAANDYIIDMRKRYNEMGGNHGAFVVAVNNSFGIDKGNPDDHPAMCDMLNALGEEGILSLAAAPNKDINVDNEGDILLGCSSEFLIGVTGTDNNDNFINGISVNGSSPKFYGWGVNSVDLAAPAINLFTTDWNGSVPSSTNQYSDGGIAGSGTSFATPLVTGTIALMYAHLCQNLIKEYKENPAVIALKIKEILLNATSPLTSLDGRTKYGRLNTFQALVDLQNNFYEKNRLLSGTQNNGEYVIATHSITTSNYNTINENILLLAGQEIILKAETKLKPSLNGFINIKTKDVALDCTKKEVFIDLIRPLSGIPCSQGEEPLFFISSVSGHAPFCFKWCKRYSSTHPWSFIGSTSMPYIHLFAEKDFELKVEVTDAYGNTASSEIQVECIDDRKRGNNTILEDNTSSLKSSLIEEDLTLKVFPQPGASFIDIQFTIPAPDNISLILYDISGKRILSIFEHQLLDKGLLNHHLNTSHIASGIYILQLKSSNGVLNKKLVISQN